MFNFYIKTAYKGIPITKIVGAKTLLDAALKLGISSGELRKNGHHCPTTLKYINKEIIAYMDDGKIINEHRRKDLLKKRMPFDELKKIIEHYQNEDWDLYLSKQSKTKFVDASGNEILIGSKVTTVNDEKYWIDKCEGIILTIDDKLMIDGTDSAGGKWSVSLCSLTAKRIKIQNK